MRGIGKEEVGLFGMIVFAGLTGFWVRSCSREWAAEKVVDEQRHEFDVQHPVQLPPCKNSSAPYIAGGSQTCAAGEIPSIRDVGQNGASRFYLFCTCEEEKKP